MLRQLFLTGIGPDLAGLCLGSGQFLVFRLSLAHYRHTFRGPAHPKGSGV